VYVALHLVLRGQSLAKEVLSLPLRRLSRY
jgi:hypothetical protein